MAALHPPSNSILSSADAHTLLGELIDIATPGLPPQLVLSRFIQSGSYAHVFEAQPYPVVVDHGSPAFAVKCVEKKGLTPSELRQQRIEVDILSKLSKIPSSSSIIRVHSVAETDSHIFLVMDKFDKDLLDVINAGVVCAAGPFYDMDDALDMSDTVKLVFNQILDAVESCHENGIFHQDIKPENILIRNADSDSVSPIVACLSDFGLATKNSMPSTFGAGSVSYTSPESLAGLDSNSRQQFYSAQSQDMWGLSVVLFMMITGHTPWYSATPDDAKFTEYQNWVKERKQHRINGSISICPPSNLRKQFGFTAEVDDMFERLFDGANVGRRLRLHELRDWVESFDVFLDADRLFRTSSNGFGASSTPVPRSGSANESVVPDNAPWPKVQDLFAVPRSWSSDISEMDYTAVPVFTSLKATTTLVLDNTPATSTLPSFGFASPQRSIDSFSYALDNLELSSTSSDTRSRGSRWNASEKAQLSRKSRGNHSFLPPTTSKRQWNLKSNQISNSISTSNNTEPYRMNTHSKFPKPKVSLAPLLQNKQQKYQHHQYQINSKPKDNVFSSSPPKPVFWKSSFTKDEDRVWRKG